MGCAVLLLLLHPKLAVTWALCGCLGVAAWVAVARVETVQTVLSEAEWFIPGAGLAKRLVVFALTVLFGGVPDPDVIVAAAQQSLFGRLAGLQEGAGLEAEL